MAEDREQIIDDSATEISPAINSMPSELPGQKVGLSMELPLFIIILSSALSGAAISNIILYRTCVQSLDHSVEECQFFLSPDKSSTNATQHLEEEVQKYSTFVFTFKMIIESVVPAVLSVFMGVWSDTHGRKPLVVWPLFGLCFTSISMVAYCMLENLGPWWFILTAVPFSLTGGFTVLFTGAFCFISDVTTTANRSFRMALLEAAVSIGSVLGSVMSSYLLRAVGNVYLLLITAALNVIAYSFTNIYVKESLTGAIRGGITTVLDLLLVKEMLRECFKRRPNKGRAQILLLTVANSLSIFILYGLMSLQYLYTREKLHWALEDFTIYSAASTSISFTGAMLGAGVIQKLFGISDLAFAIVGVLSVTADYIVRIFAVASWHMYLGASISVFKDLSAPLIRSTVTKILPVEDIAKVFSLMCALEGICPLIAPAMFNSLYSLTIDKFPGAIYVLGSSITTTSVILLGLVQYYRFKTGSSSISYTALEQ